MPGTVLIADDNLTIRKVLRSALEKEADCSVCGEAENGSIALQRVKELHPDLVVLDFSMPVLNGLEVLRALKQVRPAMPVIFFTMFKDKYLEAEAFAAGASVVISKATGLSSIVDQARILLRYSKDS